MLCTPKVELRPHLFAEGPPISFRHFAFRRLKSLDQARLELFERRIAVSHISSRHDLVRCHACVPIATATCVRSQNDYA